MVSWRNQCRSAIADWGQKQTTWYPATGVTKEQSVCGFIVSTTDHMTSWSTQLGHKGTVCMWIYCVNNRPHDILIYTAESQRNSLYVDLLCQQQTTWHLDLHSWVTKEQSVCGFTVSKTDHMASWSTQLSHKGTVCMWIYCVNNRPHGILIYTAGSQRNSLYVDLLCQKQTTWHLDLHSWVTKEQSVCGFTVPTTDHMTSWSTQLGHKGTVCMWIYCANNRPHDILIYTAGSQRNSLYVDLLCQQQTTWHLDLHSWVTKEQSVCGSTQTAGSVTECQCLCRLTGQQQCISWSTQMVQSQKYLDLHWPWAGRQWGLRGHHLHWPWKWKQSSRQCSCWPPRMSQRSLMPPFSQVQWTCCVRWSKEWDVLTGVQPCPAFSCKGCGGADVLATPYCWYHTSSPGHRGRVWGAWCLGHTLLLVPHVKPWPQYRVWGAWCLGHTLLLVPHVKPWPQYRVWGAWCLGHTLLLVPHVKPWPQYRVWGADVLATPYSSYYMSSPGPRPPPKRANVMTGLQLGRENIMVYSLAERTWSTAWQTSHDWSTVQQSRGAEKL